MRQPGILEAELASHEGKTSARVEKTHAPRAQSLQKHMGVQSLQLGISDFRFGQLPLLEKLWLLKKHVVFLQEDLGSWYKTL